jgi:N-acetyl-anhydromuramyl-L-alanine amidase AmpD
MRKDILELQGQVSSLTERVERLEEQVARLLSAKPPTVTKPAIDYVVNELRRHPTDRYSKRSMGRITHIVVHNSATRDTVTADQMARYHVNELDWPGIGYHYVIAADGTIQQTNELTSVSYHARQANGFSIGICFIGDFKDTIPSPAQMDSGAHLIAWLLQELDLPQENVEGHKAHVLSTSCPGKQWDSGQRWGDLLHARIEEMST